MIEILKTLSTFEMFFKFQMGGDSVLQKYDYVFSENGLVAYKDGEMTAKQSILEHMGEEKLQTFINFCLRFAKSTFNTLLRVLLFWCWGL